MTAPFPNTAGDGRDRAMPSARAPAASRWSLLRVSSLAGIAIASAGCDDASRIQIECVNIASGEKLAHADIQRPQHAQWGFTALDKDGFTRNVNQRQAPWWKCRNTPEAAR